MGCMLRSEPMTMCDIYLQPEVAFEVLSHFGDMGCIQFIDSMLEKCEQDIKETKQNELTLMNSYFEMTELFYVLTCIGPLLGLDYLGDVEIKRGSDLRKLCPAQQSLCLRDMLRRVSHGIVYYRQASNDKILIDPKSQTEIRKVAFLAAGQGEVLAARVQKICKGFQVDIYPSPDTQNERTALVDKHDGRIKDINEVNKGIKVNT